MASQLKVDPEVVMALAANLAGAAFNVATAIAGDAEPKAKPDLALTTTAFFDPGIKLVNVYLLVITETSRELFKTMSYALAPGTGFQFISEDVYPTLLAVKPVTGSLMTAKVLVGDQTFGVKLLRIRTVYLVNGSSFATIALLFVLITLYVLAVDVLANSTSKNSLEESLTGFHFTVATMPLTATVLMRNGAVAASALTPPTKN
jgi:hypothetical protein